MHCRFSCSLGDNNATVEATQNLLLPGNAFGGQLPNWLMARDVPFLSVQSVWVQWRLVTLEAVVGTGLLLGTVWWITKGKLAEFFHFKPTVAAVRLHLVCSKILAGWTVATTTVLLPIYIAGLRCLPREFMFKAVSDVNDGRCKLLRMWKALLA